jgi:hypothetical protein
MTAQTSRVNLLPPSEFELSFWGRFLKWAVTTGRYITILTELIVILAFLSRFKLDEDLRNLNEQINTQVGFLDSQMTKETEFLKLQNKLNLADKMLTNRFRAGDTLDYIENNLPPEVVPSRRLITINETEVTAATLNEKAMGKLLSVFSQDPDWKSVDLTQIVGDQTYGIRFTLSAKK